jgi:hypothetical protein
MNVTLKALELLLTNKEPKEELLKEIQKLQIIAEDRAGEI